MLRSLVLMCICATFALFAAAPASSQPAADAARPGARAPNLQPVPDAIENGNITVRNTGTRRSVASVVTMYCHLQDQVSGCPEMPPRYRGRYTDPAYPNMVVLRVPAIEPGQAYNHYLPYWHDMTWPPGVYQFEFTVDASGTNAELNEGDNGGDHFWMIS